MRNRVGCVALVAIIVGGWWHFNHSGVDLNPQPSSQHPVSMDVMKVGMWVVCLTQNGTPEEVASLAKAHRLAYLVVKTTDTAAWWPDSAPGGPNKRIGSRALWIRQCPREEFLRLVEACHQAGVKVYAYGRMHGDYPEVEAEMIRQSLSAGADGFVLDAEGEFCGHPDKARQLVNDALQAAAGKELFYSSFARVRQGAGLTFPYPVFNDGCLAFWAQCYPSMYRWGIDRSVSEVAHQIAEMGKEMQTDGKRLKPWAFTAECVDQRRGRSPRSLPAESLRRYLEAVGRLGHKEANIWRLEFMTPELWDVVDEFTAPR